MRQDNVRIKLKCSQTRKLCQSDWRLIFIIIYLTPIMGELSLQLTYSATNVWALSGRLLKSPFTTGTPSWDDRGYSFSRSVSVIEFLLMFLLLLVAPLLMLPVGKKIIKLKFNILRIL